MNLLSFPSVLQIMADRGIITQTDCEAMIADWWAHRANPDARFFAPILVSIGGRRKLEA